MKSPQAVAARLTDLRKEAKKPTNSDADRIRIQAAIEALEWVRSK